MDGNSTQNLIPLNPSDILQADATIIAGLLVLLTISGVLKNSTSMKLELWKFLRWFIAATSTLFSISAIAILIGGLGYFTPDMTLVFSRWIFAGGLLSLVVSIIKLMQHLHSDS